MAPAIDIFVRTYFRDFRWLSLSLFSILKFVGGAAMEVVALIVLGMLVFLAGIIVAAAVGMPFRLTKIDNDNIYIKVKPEFWNGLA